MCTLVFFSTHFLRSPEEHGAVSCVHHHAPFREGGDRIIDPHLYHGYGHGVRGQKGSHNTVIYL